MGQQIIKQPDGKYAVWSSVVDDFVMLDAERHEILDQFVADYKADLERRLFRIFEELEEGGKPYYQFTMTWDEAVETATRKHGPNCETAKFAKSIGPK